MTKLMLLSLLTFISCNPELQPSRVLLGQSNANSTLAAGMQAATTDKIIQINHPENSIEKWYNEGPAVNLNIDIAHMFTELKNEYYIDTIYWFQGESDSLEQELVTGYEARLKGVIDYIYDRLGYTPNIVIVLISGYEIGQELIERVDQIRVIQQSVADYYNGGAFDSATYGRVDSWHLSYSEYLRLGTDLI